MRVKLIGPALGRPGVGGFAPMLSLGMLATLTPPDVEVRIADEHVEPIDFDEPVDLAGITVLTPTAVRAYEIADRFRRRGVKVVLGGAHPTLMPDEAQQHADSVCRGEAEGYWPRVIEDARRGVLASRYQPNSRPNPLIVPPVRRNRFRRKGYLLRKTLFATRGCPLSCTFCSVIRMYGGGFRLRPIPEVVSEVRSLTGRGPVAFVDDNLIGDPEWAKELFRALIPCQIRWVTQVTIALAEDEELLELAAASGCIGVYVGFESVNQEGISEVGKRINRVEKYAEAIEKIHSHGVLIHGAFIFGMDCDDESVFERTVGFAQEAKLESASFGILTPFPGTPLHRQLVRDGRILDWDWSHYDIAHVVFRPRMMSAGTLREGQIWAMKEFYTVASIASRLGVLRRNLLFAGMLNLAHRRVAADLERVAKSAAPRRRPMGLT